MSKSLSSLVLSLVVSGSAYANVMSLDFINSNEKGIKFSARSVSGGGAYEAQTKGDVFKEHLDSLSFKSSYSKEYIDIVKVYEAFLMERVKREDWAKYSPVLSVAYPDSNGRSVIANVQLDIPFFYQTIAFQHDSNKDRYAMRDTFLKKIVAQNCKRLENGITRYDKKDWEEYMNFARDLTNTITFKFVDGTAVTVLTTCPTFDWSDYEAGI